MGVEGEENKKLAAEKILDKFLPRFLEKSEEMLKQNGGEFFVGKGVRSLFMRTIGLKSIIGFFNCNFFFLVILKLTYADIIMCEYLDGLTNPKDPYINAECPMDLERRVHVLDDKPLLKEHIKRIKTIPEIKEWLSLIHI